MDVKVVTIGAKGYATTYLHPLLDDMNTGKYTYAGAVAIDITECKFYDWMRESNIPTYTTLEEFYADGHTADLVVIATPPHLHFPQTMLALKNGANVLCEKPVTPLYEDALMMQKTAEENGKFVAVGYQWSYSYASRNLKKDILEGKFGKPKQLKTYVSWARNWDYYSTWKGKLRDKSGVWIHDSIASNAAAHHLHNMYFILGDAMDECTYPKFIRSELLRANDIETYDTCLLDITTENDVKIFYAVSHSAGGAIDTPPQYVFEFENGVVHFNMGGEKDHIIAEFEDGTIKDYGNPSVDYDTRLWEAIDAVKTGEKMVCTAKTAAAHTFTINQLHKNGEIVVLPEERLIKDNKKRITIVKDLPELLKKAFEEGKLLSDMGVEWTKCVEFETKR